VKNIFLKFVLIFSLCICAASGVWLLVESSNAHNDLTENVIYINEETTTQKTFEYCDLSLNPGGVSIYHIDLVCGAEGDYSIRLDFEDKGGKLKEYIFVVVVFDGQFVTEVALTEAMQNGIEMDGFLSKDQAKKLTIKYIVPSYVGNEAQGKAAQFDLTVTIDSK